MPEETTPTLLETIDATRRSILSGGVTSISSAGRNLSFIPLEELQKLEQIEKARQQTGIVMSKTRNTPYNQNY